MFSPYLSGIQEDPALGQLLSSQFNCSTAGLVHTPAYSIHTQKKKKRYDRKIPCTVAGHHDVWRGGVV